MANKDLHAHGTGRVIMSQAPLWTQLLVAGGLVGVLVFLLRW